MNNNLRNMTLTAAALAALTLTAPKAAAQWKGFPLPPSPHQVREMFQERHGGRGDDRRDRGNGAWGNRGGYENHGNDGNRGYGNYGNRGYGNYGGYGYRGYGADRGYRNYGGRAFVGPVRPYVRGYASPFRVFSGFRFYNACPGPGYVYIADLGWALPPYASAAWIPGFYDEEGFWVEGYWR